MSTQEPDDARSQQQFWNEWFRKKAGIHIHSFNTILIGLFLSIWMQGGGFHPPMTFPFEIR